MRKLGMDVLKRFLLVPLLLMVLLCSSCVIDYDRMPTAEIIKRTIDCSDQQAQHIADILMQCGATKLQNIEYSGNGSTQFRLYYPEGVLWAQVDHEKNLRAIAGRSDTTMYLFRDNEQCGTLIASQTERQYYADTTEAIIRSIEDMLTTVSFIGKKEQVPDAYEYEGDVFVYDTLDGIARVSFTLAGYVKSQRVPFRFVVEYAMLQPVSLTLKDEELIAYAWNGALDGMEADFQRLRREAAARTTPFTEEDLQKAMEAIQAYENGEKDTYEPPRRQYSTTLAKDPSKRLP